MMACAEFALVCGSASKHYFSDLPRFRDVGFDLADGETRDQPFNFCGILFGILLWGPLESQKKVPPAGIEPATLWLRRYKSHTLYQLS